MKKGDFIDCIFVQFAAEADKKAKVELKNQHCRETQDDPVRCSQQFLLPQFPPEKIECFNLALEFDSVHVSAAGGNKDQFGSAHLPPRSCTGE